MSCEIFTTKYPNWVVENSTARPVLYRVLLIMSFMACDHGALRFDDWAAVTRISCVSERTTKKYIKELVDDGHLTEIAPLTWQIETGN